MSRIGDTENQGTAQSGNLGESAQKVAQDLRDLGAQVRETARDKYEEYTGQAREYYSHQREAAQQWEHEVESFIQEKPVQAVLIAAGVGLLIGLMWRH